MKTIKKITLLLILLVVTYSFAQTGVTVNFYDGNTQVFNVENSGKLYFDSDNLKLKINSSTTNEITIPVTIIRKISFSNSLASSTFIEHKNNLVLYPNPSSNFIKIKSDVDEKLKINIYSIIGQLVHQGSYQSNEDINVSNLSSGLYLVQVNGITLKFCKK